MTPTLAAQSPPITRRQMHEELFADDGSSTQDDGTSFSDERSSGGDDHSADWIAEARKEAFERKEGRSASRPPEIKPLESELLSGELLGSDSLEGELPEFIDKFIGVEAAGVAAMEPSETIENSDEILFLRYQNGDDRAFFAIYERYKSSIYAYCAHVLFSVGLSREVVEDTFQDVFMRLVQYRHTFTGGDFRPWIFTVTRHSCLSAKRISFKQSAGMEYVGNDENFEDRISSEMQAEFARSDDPFEQMAKKEQTALLLDAIALLPIEFREALVLSEYEGLSYEEIGKITGTSLSTIRIRIFRAKARLRKMLLPVIGDNADSNQNEEAKKIDAKQSLKNKK